MAGNKDIEIVKKGYSKDRYGINQIDELRRCMADPIYFCEKYVKVQHPIKGRVPFKLYPYQVGLIEAFHTNQYCIALTARQMGKTTCAAGFLLWKAMFEPDTTILIAGNKYLAALEIMDRIRFAYENLEEYNWLRAGVTEYNKGTISFDNGSRIISRATSKDAGRGLSISLLYVDEFAFVAPNAAAEFWSAIQPTLSTGGSCIITSTPNHDEDQFAQIWHGANDPVDEHGNEIPNGLGRNGFFPVKVTWDHHPDRDDQWEKKQRAQLGDDIFDRENNCRFISFEETLIAPVVLAGLKFSDPIFKIGEIRWFEDAKPNHIYSVTLDPSTGTGGDHAAIVVYDLTTMTQVAEWRHHLTPPRGQIEQMMRILYYLYQTMASHPDQVSEPEIFWTLENNTVATAHLQIIDETGEENIPGTFVHERNRGVRKAKGLNTNARTKMTACSRLKSLVDSNRMKVKSRGLITELKNFINSGEGFKARPSQTDDLVMATLLAVRVLEHAASWDETLGEMLSDAIDADDFDISPMPFSM